MGNNKEIRQRMETYRSVLLVLNWIVSSVGIIVGFFLIDKVGGLAAIIIIVALILGIIGQFLINVALAIPFILLNNGDILESLKGKMGSTTASNNDWTCSKCGKMNRESALFCTGCGGKNDL